MSDPNNSGNNSSQQNQQSQQVTGQQQQGQQQTFSFTGNGAAANNSIWIYPVGPTYTITLGGDAGGGGTCESAPKKEKY